MSYSFFYLLPHLSSRSPDAPRLRDGRRGEGAQIVCGLLHAGAHLTAALDGEAGAQRRPETAGAGAALDGGSGRRGRGQRSPAA